MTELQVHVQDVSKVNIYSAKYVRQSQFLDVQAFLEQPQVLVHLAQVELSQSVENVIQRQKSVQLTVIHVEQQVYVIFVIVDMFWEQILFQRQQLVSRKAIQLMTVVLS